MALADVEADLHAPVCLAQVQRAVGHDEVTADVDRIEACRHLHVFASFAASSPNALPPAMLGVQAG